MPTSQNRDVGHPGVEWGRAKDGSRFLRNDKPRSGRLGFGVAKLLNHANFEGLAEDLHRAGDSVDLGGVTEVGEAVHFLRCRAQAPG